MSMGKWDEEIRRKALAGIALTNPTKEAQAKYDSYRSTGTSKNNSNYNNTSNYANTTQGRTGQVQYSPIGTFTNAPKPSNIQLTNDMVDEIKNKAAKGIPLSNWSEQKQELYNGYKNPTPVYQEYKGGPAPTYSSQYGGLIEEALSKLLGGTGKFSYNYQDDPLYQQYKESYRREGDRALENSMAEATALTGGRVNSNAIIAGQQAQNYNNAQLNDKIPELEQYAYQKYLNELQQKRSNIDTLQRLEAQDYAKYQDQLAQYNTDRNFEYQALMDKNNYNYQNYRDTQNYDRSVIESNRAYDYNLWNAQNALAQDKRNYDYQVERDKVGDSQWQKQFDQAVSEFAQQMAYNKERAAASDSQWERQFAQSNDQWNRQFARSNYEFDTTRNDNLKQQAITNALNDYKVHNTTGKSNQANQNGYTFKDYSNQVKSLMSEKNTTTGTRTVSNQSIREMIDNWCQSGYITNEEANKLFDMYGL